MSIGFCVPIAFEIEYANALIRLNIELSAPRRIFEVIRITWMRPEDVKDYHRLGVTHFKLDGRIASSNYNLERISAYLRGQYEGNLLYLLMENVPRTRYNASDELYPVMKRADCSLDTFFGKRAPTFSSVQARDIFSINKLRYQYDASLQALTVKMKVRSNDG